MFDYDLLNDIFLFFLIFDVQRNPKIKIKKGGFQLLFYIFLLSSLFWIYFSYSSIL